MPAGSWCTFAIIGGFCTTREQIGACGVVEQWTAVLLGENACCAIFFAGPGRCGRGSGLQLYSTDILRSVSGCVFSLCAARWRQRWRAGAEGGGPVLFGRTCWATRLPKAPLSACLLSAAGDGRYVSLLRDVVLLYGTQAGNEELVVGRLRSGRAVRRRWRAACT